MKQRIERIEQLKEILTGIKVCHGLQEHVLKRSVALCNIMSSMEEDVKKQISLLDECTSNEK